MRSFLPEVSRVTVHGHGPSTSMKRQRSDPATGLLRANLGRALDCLAETGKIDARVHAARKALKRARAALRLMRPALASEVYERENRSLRDAARCLSPLRDARSLVVAAALLDRSRVKTAAGAAAMAALRRILEQRLDAARSVFAEPAARRRCAQLVKACRQRMLRDRPPRADALKLLAGLRRIYRNGRRSLARASAERTPEALHEWRKQTKYLREAAGALSDAGVRPLKRVVQRCADIAARLGDDHDLVELRHEIERTFPAKAGAETVLSRLDARRQRLQRDALDRGARTFRKEPGQFVADLSVSRL
jgi:CHAD domain-containing protein